MTQKLNRADSRVVSRRALLQIAVLAGAGVALNGCGFKLRGSQAFAFKSIAILPSPGSAMTQELRSAFGSDVQVLAAEAPGTPAQLVLTVADEVREKAVIGVNVSGQVREFQLRLRVRLSVRTAKGKAITVNEEIAQRRDISYNESAALAKEAEEALLFRDMQTDIVQQILRRLAAIQPGQMD